LKKNKISKNWIRKQHKDQFVKKSKIQGYRSRSAYKLIEMNEKFKFLKYNSNLLDLGSSPGGWSQVASKEIKKGKILGIDIKPMDKIDGVDFINGDFCNKEIQKNIMSYFNNKIDVVISDTAANTTGNQSLDAYKTGELCLTAMDFSIKILSERGFFLSKMFMGSIYDEIRKKAKKSFKTAVTYKPEASRKESNEVYIFCKGAFKI